jgi:N-acyl-L-homoserine lactone synthetase
MKTVTQECNLLMKIGDSTEIHEFQKLLFNVYCLKLGWHSPEKFPDGIFTDEYDSRSTFLTVYHGDTLSSGVRLVADGVGGFPHEKISGITLPYKTKSVDRLKTMEITRFIGNPAVKRIHTYDLMKALYWFGLSHGIELYFMVVDMSAFLLCHKLKFPIVPIATPLFCEGSWTIPALLTIEDMPKLLTGSGRENFLDSTNVAWV